MAELAKGGVLGRDLLEVLREDRHSLGMFVASVLAIVDHLELLEGVGHQEGLGLLGEGLGGGGEGSQLPIFTAFDAPVLPSSNLTT